VSLEKLTWDYSLGGFRLPNFKKYYLVAQMRYILSFFDSDAAPSWIQIGLHPLREGTLSDYIYKWKSKTKSNSTDNPILKHFIKIWYEVKKNLGLNLRLSPKTPLRRNELVPMTLDNKILETWHDGGSQHLEDCFDKGCLMFFEERKRKYDLSRRTFFCYLQLRSFLRTNLGPKMTLPVLTNV